MKSKKFKIALIVGLFALVAVTYFFVQPKKTEVQQFQEMVEQAEQERKENDKKIKQDNKQSLSELANIL